MNPWDYLKPENPLAQIVVTVLVALFAGWVVLLAYAAARALNYRGQMRRLTGVGPLVGALQGRFTKRESAGEAEAGAAPGGEEAMSAAAADFFEERGVKGTSPVARHVRSIFAAGWDESRLDVGELIKHTSGEVLAFAGPLRSLLAIFIIVGLLGTLFGLADSLSQLAPLVQSESVSNKDLAKALADLLGRLKSAFAPSILGVLFTVAGVALLTLYLHLVAAPTKSRLERLTLSGWVPALFPTTSQRMLETLQLSEKQMQKSFAAAEEVARFAKDVQGDVGELRGNIKAANKTLTLLEKSSSRINDFSDKFVEAVNGLTPFQEDLRALYEQMLAESRAFRDSVSASVKESEDFLEDTVGVLDHQSQQIKAVLAALHSYEAAYVEERQQIDATIREVLEAARNAFEETGNRNEEVVAALGAPLRDELSERLGKVEETLGAKLESIVQRFGAFDAPINEAARKIEGSLEAVVNRTEKLTNQLQGEFLKQNETNQKQLEQIGEFNEKIAALLTELVQSGRVQGEGAQALGGIMQKLSEQVAQMNESLAALAARPPLAGADGGGRGLESYAEGLLRNGADQTRQIQYLASEVRNIGNTLSAMRASGGGGVYERGGGVPVWEGGGQQSGPGADYVAPPGRIRRVIRWLGLGG